MAAKLFLLCFVTGLCQHRPTKILPSRKTFARKYCAYCNTWCAWASAGEGETGISPPGNWN